MFETIKCISSYVFASHVSCTSSLAQKVGAESASHVHCRFMVASDSSQCDVSSACESQMAREGLVRMFMVESRQIGFPPHTARHFDFAPVQFRPLSFRCNCVLWNGQGACENSVCDFMFVLACQRDHVACSSQSLAPLLTTCDVPCFLCVWYVERCALAFDGRATLSAIIVCVLEFSASQIVQGALATSVCHLVLCVRIAREWHTCLLDPCIPVGAVLEFQNCLWWCWFEPETHCTVPSVWCQQMVSVLVPRWTLLWFILVRHARSLV